MMSKFKLRQRIRRLEYEGIHLVCFGCGLYGHRKDSCPLEQKEPTAAPKEGTKNDLSDIPARRDKESLRKYDNFINLKIVETYGPWMLATRRTRFPKTKKILIVLCMGKESLTIPLALILAETIKEIIHPDLCH